MSKTMNADDPKYLRKHELKYDIMAMANGEPDRSFKRNDGHQDRRFTNAEKCTIAMALFEDYLESDSIYFGWITLGVIEDDLEELENAELVPIILELVGIETGNSYGKDYKFSRDELKKIYTHLKGI